MSNDSSSPDAKPVIAVCGARGAQGSNVIHSLLTDGIFTVRAITRHPVGSVEADSLATLGVEVIQADYDKPDTLVRAFEGCYGVFAVTDFYEAGASEVQQGKNIVDAAKMGGIKHFLWSSGPDTNGEVQNYDFKAAVASHLLESGLSYTCILTPVYYDTVLILLEKNPTGGFVLKVGYPIDSRIPFTDPSDVGAWAASVFLDPDEWMNKTINPCNEWLTPRELGQTFSEIVGEACQVAPITVEQFLAFEPEHESMHNLKSHMKYLLGSYDRQEWSPALGQQLSPQPKLWQDICREKVEADEGIMKSPTDNAMMFNAQLNIQVICDYEEEAM